MVLTPTGKEEEIQTVNKYNRAQSRLHDIIASTPNIPAEIRVTLLTNSPLETVEEVHLYVLDEDKPVISRLRRILLLLASTTRINQINHTINVIKPIPSVDIEVSKPTGMEDEFNILLDIVFANNMLYNINVSTSNISPEIRRTLLMKSPFEAIQYIDQYVRNEDKPIINRLRRIFHNIASDPAKKHIYDRIEAGEPIPTLVFTPTGKEGEIQTVDKYNRAKRILHDIIASTPSIPAEISVTLLTKSSLETVEAHFYVRDEDIPVISRLRLILHLLANTSRII